MSPPHLVRLTWSLGDALDAHPPGDRKFGSAPCSDLLRRSDSVILRLASSYPRARRHPGSGLAAFRTRHWHRPLEVLPTRRALKFVDWHLPPQAGCFSNAPFWAWGPVDYPAAFLPRTINSAVTTRAFHSIDVPANEAPCRPSEPRDGLNPRGTVRSPQLISGNWTVALRDRVSRRRARSWNASRITSLTRRS